MSKTDRNDRIARGDQGELHGTLVEVRGGDIACGRSRAARHRVAGDLPVQIVNVGWPDKTSDEWRHLDTTPGHAVRLL